MAKSEATMLSVPQRIGELLVKYDCSFRELGRFVGTDHSYLQKVYHGKKEPSATLIEKLGLINKPFYLRKAK